MKIVMEELSDLQSELNSNMKSILAKLDNVQNKTNHIGKLTSFQGKAADNAKVYFGSVHGQSVDELKKTISLLQKNLAKLTSDFKQTVDHSSTAILTEGYLQEMDKKVLAIKNDMVNTHYKGENSIKEVADIIPLCVPSLSSFTNNISDSSKHINQVNEHLHEFDKRALQIVEDSGKEVDKIKKKLSKYTAKSLSQSSMKDLNLDDFGVKDETGLFGMEKAVVAMNAGYKAFTKLHKYLNKANKASEIAAQLYVYFKLDPKISHTLHINGVNALTKEQYRQFNNVLSNTIYKVDSKRFFKHLKEYKMKAFTKDNMQALKSSVEVFSSKRGKLAMAREFEKRYGIDKFRDLQKLTTSKHLSMLATTFTDEFIGNKYKSTKKLVQGLPAWKNPKLAYNDMVKSFKESTKDLNSLGKGAKVLGKGLGPLSVGAVAVDNYKTYKGDTQKIVVGTAVDGAFSAGATTIGAAVGSVLVPPIGTVIGAGVGVGVSYAASKKWGKPPKSTTERTKDFVNKGVDSVSNATKKIGKKFSGWFK